MGLLVSAKGLISRVFGKRFFICNRVKIGKVNKTLQYLWSYLNDSRKGFYPARQKSPLTGESGYAQAGRNFSIPAFGGNPCPVGVTKR
jgi:hypothetical protein